MQSLLADRFKLAIHFETREVPVLALTLVKPGKTGPKFIPHDEGPSCDTPDVIPPRCGSTFRMRSSTGLFTGGARDVSLEIIASGLSGLGNLDRPVLDRTGLTGKFDYKLEWTPEPNGTTPPNPDAQPDPQGTTFLQALREQLGLKVESTKGPIATPVIDRIERPSEN
jgi:bla regulator protein blaR1